MFQALACGVAGVAGVSLTRHRATRSAPSRADHGGGDQGADRQAGSPSSSVVLPSTSGPWWAARPSAVPAESSTASTSTSTTSPTRSSARWATSSSARLRDPLHPVAHDLVRSSLPASVAASVPSSSE